jgi:hypothetical protein
VSGECSEAARWQAGWRRARRSLIRRKAGKSAVHAWRTATRRLFALEELLAPAVTGPHANALHALLRHAFHAAGQLRDTQLAIGRLQQLAPRFPAALRLARHLHRGLARQRKLVTRRVRDVKPRAVRALLISRGMLHVPDIEKLTARATRRLRRAALLLRHADHHCRNARSLHRYRVRLKSLRYMEDFGRAAGLRATRERGSTLQINRLQHRLGKVTDIQMLLETIDRFAARHPRWKREAAPLRQHLCHQRLQLLPAAGMRQVPMGKARG